MGTAARSPSILMMAWRVVLLSLAALAVAAAVANGRVDSDVGGMDGVMAMLETSRRGAAQFDASVTAAKNASSSSGSSSSGLSSSTASSSASASSAAPSVSPSTSASGSSGDSHSSMSLPGDEDAMGSAEEGSGSSSLDHGGVSKSGAGSADHSGSAADVDGAHEKELRRNGTTVATRSSTSAGVATAGNATAGNATATNATDDGNATATVIKAELVLNATAGNDTDCDNSTAADDKAPSPYHCKTKKNGKFKGKWVDLDKQVVHQQTHNFQLADLKNATNTQNRIVYRENENMRDILRGLSRSFAKKPTDRCAPMEDCEQCLAKSNADFECGWCSTKKKCYEMNAGTQGPLYGSCPPGHWHPETCPESCADKTKYGCSVCLTDPHCGWCNQDNTCRDGNMEAPVDGSTCSCWRWGNCEQDCLSVAKFDCHCNKTAEDQNATEFEKAHEVEVERNKSINNGSVPNLIVHKNGTVECSKKDNGTAFDTDEDMIDTDPSVDDEMKTKYEDTIDPDMTGRNGTVSPNRSEIILVATPGANRSSNIYVDAANMSRSVAQEQAYFSCKQTCFNQSCHMPVWRDRYPLVTQYTTCKHACLSRPCTDPKGSSACYESCATKECTCDDTCKGERSKLRSEYTAWLYANEVCVLDCRHSCANAGLKLFKVSVSVPYTWSIANRGDFQSASTADALASLSTNATGAFPGTLTVQWLGLAAPNNTAVGYTLSSETLDMEDPSVYGPVSGKVAHGNFTNLKNLVHRTVEGSRAEVVDMPSPAMQHVGQNMTAL